MFSSLKENSLFWGHFCKHVSLISYDLLNIMKVTCDIVWGVRRFPNGPFFSIVNYFTHIIINSLLLRKFRWEFLSYPPIIHNKFLKGWYGKPSAFIAEGTSTNTIKWAKTECIWGSGIKISKPPGRMLLYSTA